MTSLSATASPRADSSASDMQPTVTDRARLSLGISQNSIYRTVRHILERRNGHGGRLLDVGCGAGFFFPIIRDIVESYSGADVVRYAEFPPQLSFAEVDLDSGRIPVDDGTADIVVAIETIEHLENPRAFMRELTRICVPGGLVIVTTPNQLSLLSKLTLLLKDQFNAFQGDCYPAHITALLPVDLERMASECKLHEIRIDFTRDGRIPGCSWHYPQVFGKVFPKSFSDNVILSARRAGFIKSQHQNPSSPGE